MSAKGKKSVLGEGVEFGWVGGSQPARTGGNTETGNEAAPEAAAPEEGAVGESAAEEPKRRRGTGRRNQDTTPKRQVAKETSRQMDEPLQKVSFYLEPGTALELKMQAVRERLSRIKRLACS